MGPTNIQFGGGGSDSVLHPIVLVAMLLLLPVILFGPRKYVLWAFMPLIFLVPLGQNVNIAGSHIFVERIAVLTGWFRISLLDGSKKKLFLAGGFQAIDKLFLVWALVRAISICLVWKDTSAFINQVGFLWSCVGGYFLLRSLIRDKHDVKRVAAAFAVLAVLFAVEMTYEQKTSKNLFGQLGGVRSTPDVREGKIRSHAVFQHSLLAGTFGATLVPLMFWLWKCGKAKALAATGVIGATGMVITCASSTPLLTYVAGVLGLCLWPLRRRLAILRWGLVLTLLCLHLVMKAPVWFLIARVDLVGGSSGYHRAMLIDQFIAHFGDWWIVGTNQAVNWGWDMWDTCNQFVEEGEKGGLIALMAFIGVIVVAFRLVGQVLRARWSDSRGNWSAWILGAALFANVVAFWGISYFDQTQTAWLMLLAMIVATCTKPQAVQESSPAPIRSETLAGDEIAPLLATARSMPG